MNEPRGSLAAATAQWALCLFILCPAATGCDPARRQDSAPVGPPADARETELVALREALAAERSRRQELEGEVEWLRYQLEEFVWDVPERVREDEQQDDVAASREAFARSEMELLQLEDRARREGWYGGSRYSQALRDLRGSLRAELGDESYDRLLFASGRRNRVVVDDLLDRSPAQQAGIQPDDVICRYDGSRVFRAGELKGATSEGSAGELVAVEVMREGEHVRIYVPRGPLGVKISQARRLPAEGC
jgi:C-terminal processing protease CtpA/Prc